MKCPPAATRFNPLRLSLAIFILLAGVSSPVHAGPVVPPPGMAYVPEGYFQMGSASGADDEKPAHYVYTSAYFIDKYEVSNAQYKEFMKATGHPPPKFWEDERFNPPDFPAVGVSWHDAMAYARWKGRRLPTEAEWEKAARGKDGRLFPWGNQWDPGAQPFLANVFGKKDRYPLTAPVKSFEPGASPYGVLNMAGNVAEWCLDWYDPDYYLASPEINPEGPSGPPALNMKAVRGGSWVNGPDNARTFKRYRNDPNVKNNVYGFRTVLPAR
ncbi:MAG: formylglycine-generating enzyme family protein [Nitrospinae bacterium]|nr:formylglycine-generating enzyme family protein [Nitrospinota bacterium]